MIARIKFWWDVIHHRAPSYENREGGHIFPDSYSILLDRVKYRQGRFGYVEFEGFMSRENYVAHEEDGYWTRREDA